MKRKLLLCFGIIASIAGLAGFFLACGSGPSSAGEGLPVWVTSTPGDTDESVYFIGIGTSDTGDVAEAENMAASSMMTEITRFLGVRITAETSVEARDTLETYEQEMTQKIKEESAAQIGDFRVVEKHIEREDGRVTVYILGEYDRDVLLKEQKRIQAVFAEQREAISGPEREGDMLVDEEEYYKAARKYIEAASAAATSKVDNAAIKLERNINKAMKAIDFVNLFPLSSNLVTNVKETFDRPFSCKVAAGSSKKCTRRSGSECADRVQGNAAEQPNGDRIGDRSGRQRRHRLLRAARTKVRRHRNSYHDARFRFLYGVFRRRPRPFSAVCRGFGRTDRR